MNQTRLNKLLFMAIYQLNLEDVTTLLEEGADIHCKEFCNFGDSFLEINPLELSVVLCLNRVAISNLHLSRALSVLQKVLEMGANPNIITELSKTKQTLLQHILNTCKLSCKDDVYHYKGVWYKTLQIVVDVLLKHGADPNFYTPKHLSPTLKIYSELYQTKSFSFAKILQSLLMHGANIYFELCDCENLNFVKDVPILYMIYCMEKKNLLPILYL
jgi:hypothetical protein